MLAGGLAIRVGPVATSDFPVNDGGLFSLVIEAVRRERFGLPSTIPYNGLEIPFAYPPLGFYMAAAVAEIGRLDAIQVLRFLPLAFNLFAMAAFYLLARTVVASRAGAVAALAILCLLPGSYQWLIGGGGLTRSLGLGFTLLALREAYLLARDGSNGRAVGLAVFAGLATLSHLEMTWLLAYSTGLVFLAFGRTWRSFLRFVAAGLGAAAVVAPWALVVRSRHGAGPFLSAANTGSALSPGSEDIETIILVVGALLVFALLAWTAEERLFLTGWIGCIALLNSRSIWLVVFPICLGAGKVVSAALLPRLGSSSGGLAQPPVRAGPWSRVASLGASALVLVVAGWGLRTSIPQWDDARGALGVLSREDRAAMAWIAANAPPSSRFIVVTGGGWARDRVGEWLPVLASRVGASTVQGTEWLPDGAFRAKLRLWLRLQECGERGALCLEEWRRTAREETAYVYVVRWEPDCCARLREELRADAGHRVVFDGPTATIFERLPRVVGAGP